MSENQTPAEPTPKSFVDPKDYQTSKTETPPETTKVEGKEIRILKPEIALTLIYGKLDQILTEMKMLNGTFSKASEPKTFVNASPQTPVQTAQPAPAQSMAPLQTPPAPAEQTPRVKEILTALEPVKDLLKIDTEGSTMFVMVKPAQFLGSDNFAKVAQIVRAIGGQYVSAGKNSHFEISKAPLRKQ